MVTWKVNNAINKGLLNGRLVIHIAAILLYVSFDSFELIKVRIKKSRILPSATRYKIQFLGPIRHTK